MWRSVLRAAVRNAPQVHHRGARGAAHDLIARLGGDEFAILLENVDAEGAIRVADRIREAIHCGVSNWKPGSVHHRQYRHRPTATPATIHPTEILRDADTAMYKAKSLGRSRFEVFEAGMRAQAVARLELESDLRRAVDHREFVLYYQPKVSLKTGKIVGVEALIRWRHPEHGIVPPDEFIPAGRGDRPDRSHRPMGVARGVQRRCAAGMNGVSHGFPPLEISVNVSVRQFREPDLQAPRFRGHPGGDGLDPATLQLEITESVLMDDLEAVACLLDGLKIWASGLKIDDFGTGYASLNASAGCHSTC